LRQRYQRSGVGNHDHVPFGSNVCCKSSTCAASSSGDSVK
jgi:hypothetical protein